MDDFDLSQALEGPLDLDETGTNSRCFDDTDVQGELIRLDEGLDLEVSCSKPSMTKVARLVLVVSRWNALMSRLSDDELCSAIMENLVEETPAESVVSSCPGQSSAAYTRVDSVECTLCDTRQRAVILNSGRLQAITLRGGYSDCKVRFKVAHYVSHRETSQSVVLSIKNSSWHISCSMEGDKAVLSLEECSKESLKQISEESMKRFLFYKRKQGVSLTMFESVMCSSWFISTSPDKEDQPVEMCKEETSYRLTSFKVV